MNDDGIVEVSAVPGDELGDVTPDSVLEGLVVLSDGENDEGVVVDEDDDVGLETPELVVGVAIDTDTTVSMVCCTLILAVSIVVTKLVGSFVTV
jgi:hypothetical protein